MSDIDELVVRAKGGDKRAFELLYTEYYAGILRFIGGKVRNDHTAQDLASETFLKAWRSIGSMTYRPGSNSFQAWIFTIARNVTTDYFRLRSRRPEVLVDEFAPDGVLSPSPEATVIQRAGLDAILRLSGLDQRQKQCIILRFVVGMTVPEVAETLGIPLGTVKSLQSRALLKIKGLAES